jgi:flavodoxin
VRKIQGGENMENANESKVLIVYCSRHLGNTYIIANVIGEELNATLKEISDVTQNEITKYCLVGFGSGVYAFGMDRKLIKFLKNLENSGKKKVFLFSTSADPKGLKYHKKVKKILKNKEFELIGEFNCQGEYLPFPFLKKLSLNRGKPFPEDIEKAREFARELHQKYLK